MFRKLGLICMLFVFVFPAFAQDILTPSPRPFSVLYKEPTRGQTLLYQSSNTSLTLVLNPSQKFLAVSYDMSQLAWADEQAIYIDDFVVSDDGVSIHPSKMLLTSLLGTSVSFKEAALTADRIIVTYADSEGKLNTASYEAATGKLNRWDRACGEFAVSSVGVAMSCTAGYNGANDILVWKNDENTLEEISISTEDDHYPWWGALGLCWFSGALNDMTLLCYDRRIDAIDPYVWSEEPPTATEGYFATRQDGMTNLYYTGINEVALKFSYRELNEKGLLLLNGFIASINDDGGIWAADLRRDPTVMPVIVGPAEKIYYIG